MVVKGICFLKELSWVFEQIHYLARSWLNVYCCDFGENVLVPCDVEEWKNTLKGSSDEPWWKLENEARVKSETRRELSAPKLVNSFYRALQNVCLSPIPVLYFNIIPMNFCVLFVRILCSRPTKSVHNCEVICAPPAPFYNRNHFISSGCICMLIVLLKYDSMPQC